MKKAILLSLIALFLLSCRQNTTNQEIDVEGIIADTTTVYVLYFRINRRCENCDAVADVAQRVVKEVFADNDNVRYLEIANSVRANEPLLKKFDVYWNALIIRKGDEFTDVTQRAFLHVLRNRQFVENVIIEQIENKLGIRN